jgi:hypothetical protein
MSFDPRTPSGTPPDGPSSQGSARPTPPGGQAGSQGASRGGRAPDTEPDDRFDDRSDERTYYTPPRGGAGTRRGGSGQRGSGFASWLPGGRGGSGTFFGIPLTIIYLIGASIIGLVFIGAVCSPRTTTGSVAGQVKALGSDRQVASLPGAQVIVRSPSNTWTTVTTDVPDDATGEAAYNYRIENLPAGNYTMAVTPPAGSDLQPEGDINFKVESGQLFPQSVLLLAQGIQKPRPLAPSEVEPGQVGYINDRGERVVYQQGGIDATDVLLLYLLWRQPPLYGYGAPPIIYTGSRGSTSTGSNYRVEPPPTTTRSGQTVTQRPPSVPGQGSTRPSGSSGSTGAGPTYNSGAPSTGSGSSTSSGSSSSGSSTTTRPSSPSQGATRPSSGSSSSSSPSSSSGSRSSSSGSRSSGGGRR